MGLGRKGCGWMQSEAPVDILGRPENDVGVGWSSGMGAIEIRMGHPEREGEPIGLRQQASPAGSRVVARGLVSPWGLGFP